MAVEYDPECIRCGDYIDEDEFAFHHTLMCRACYSSRLSDGPKVSEWHEVLLRVEATGWGAESQAVKDLRRDIAAEHWRNLM